MGIIKKSISTRSFKISTLKLQSQLLDQSEKCIRKTRLKTLGINLLVPRPFLEEQFFSTNSSQEFGVAKLRALLHNVTIQLASHLDVLYIVEFLFKSNDS